MGKLKTRRAAAKRFQIKKSGKVMRRHSGLRHLLECKSNKKKRGMGNAVEVKAADTARVRSMLAGGQ
jgi:large subunit ribosomal protein L35